MSNLKMLPQGCTNWLISTLVFLTVMSAVPAKSQESWTCEESALYSVYEDVARTKGRRTASAKTLKWIDADTVGIESISLVRIDPNSETFFSQSSGSFLYMSKLELPYIVILTQPQVWMNKFGALRVRFYRCMP